MQALARAVKVVGVENVYPKKIGHTYLGDAHWACLPHTPVYSQVNVLKTVQDIASMALDGQIGDTVALLGGRFVSSGLVRKMSWKCGDAITLI